MRRKIFLLALLLPLFILPCRGEGLSYPQVDELLREAEGYGVTGTEDLGQGVQNLAEAGLAQLSGLFRRSLQTGLKLLAAALLCTLAEGIAPEGGKGGLSAVELAGALAVTALTMSDMTAMIGLGRETIARMDAFAGVLLPAVATLTAATGGVTSAAVRQGVTILFSDLLISAIDRLLVPLLYAYVASCCAHAALGNQGLAKLAALLKGGVTFLLTGGLLIFVGYLTASGAIAGSADAAAVKAAKLTISRAIPVVGGVLSDAAETVLAGAGVLRGTVGVAGMLVVLAICLTPFLQLAIHYFTYKGAAALTGMVAGGNLGRLMDHIGGAFGMILGMTGSCALILLFSLVSAISAVTGG